MSHREALERRYRRLLAWYPADHRRVHAEEMVGVLLAAAPQDRRRPSIADALDLIKGGLQTRIRPGRPRVLMPAGMTLSQSPASSFRPCFSSTSPSGCGFGHPTCRFS